MTFSTDAPPRAITSCVVLACILAPLLCMGQYHATIRSDRPGQTIGPFSVGTGVLQQQFGGSYLGTANDPQAQRGYDLESVIRFGLSETFELNTGFNYTSQSVRTVTDERFANNGVSNLRLGCRYTIRQVDGWKPALGIQLTLQLPVGATPYRPDYLAPSITGILAQPLGERFSHNLITTLSYNGIDPVPGGFYAYSMGYSITDKLGVFVEPYGSYRGDDYVQSFDGGLSYNLTDDTQLDLFGGGSVGEEIDSYFVSLGFSWRVKTVDYSTMTGHLKHLLLVLLLLTPLACVHAQEAGSTLVSGEARGIIFWHRDVQDWAQDE